MGTLSLCSGQLVVIICISITISSSFLLASLISFTCFSFNWFVCEIVDCFVVFITSVVERLCKKLCKPVHVKGVVAKYTVLNKSFT